MAGDVGLVAQGKVFRPVEKAVRNAGMRQVGPEQVCIGEVGRIQVGAHERSQDEFHATEVRPVGVCPVEVRPVGVCMGEYSMIETGSQEVDAEEEGISQFCVRQVGAAEHHTVEVCPIEGGSYQTGERQVDPEEAHVVQVDLGELATAQVQAKEVKFDVWIFPPPLVESAYVILHEQSQEMWIVDGNTRHVHVTSLLFRVATNGIRKALHSITDQVALSILTKKRPVANWNSMRGFSAPGGRTEQGSTFVLPSGVLLVHGL